MPRLTRAVAAVAVAAALAPAVAASAATPAREARATYTAAGGATGVATVSAGGQGSTIGSVGLPVQRGERRVTLRIADNTGLPVAAEVVQVLDEQTGEYTSLGELCGPAARTFRLASPTAPVAVRPVAGACGSTVSVPTQGIVTAAFRR
jgi:hypothetical protein